MNRIYPKAAWLLHGEWRLMNKNTKLSFSFNDLLLFSRHLIEFVLVRDSSGNSLILTCHEVHRCPRYMRSEHAGCRKHMIPANTMSRTNFSLHHSLPHSSQFRRQPDSILRGLVTCELIVVVILAVGDLRFFPVMDFSSCACWKDLKKLLLLLFVGILFTSTLNSSSFHFVDESEWHS